jgi:hypothetical protein
MSEELLLLALGFLFIHLLTDARRMVQVLRRRHSKYHGLDPCPRCEATSAGIKEAWWEVITFVALVGHLIFDYTG